ncbi:MAG: hypothetical protein ABI723_00360 [Bacteroidia bacterium]
MWFSKTHRPDSYRDNCTAKAGVTPYLSDTGHLPTAGRKINISGATYELVKDKFNCFHRGKIQAKNKGEIDMYFVETLS